MSRATVSSPTYVIWVLSKYFRKFGRHINNRAESESGNRRADSHVFDGSILLNTKIQFSGSGALGCALLFIYLQLCIRMFLNRRELQHY